MKFIKVLKERNGEEHYFLPVTDEGCIRISDLKRFRPDGFSLVYEDTNTGSLVSYVLDL